MTDLVSSSVRKCVDNWTRPSQRKTLFKVQTCKPKDRKEMGVDGSLLRSTKVKSHFCIDKQTNI